MNFIDCTAWGKTGETINQYMQKGKPIFIEGRLKYDSWEDKQGGGKRSKLTVVVDNFQFVGGRDGGGGGGRDDSGGNQAGDEQAPPRRSGPPPQRGQRPAPPAQQQQPEAPFGEEQQFSEDDIPF